MCYMSNLPDWESMRRYNFHKKAIPLKDLVEFAKIQRLIFDELNDTQKLGVVRSFIDKYRHKF